MKTRSLLRVALIAPVIPIYRVPLFANLATCKEIDITCFHSPGNRYGARSVGTDLPIRNHYGPTLYLPGRAAPVFQFLVTRVLMGGFDVVVCTQSINNGATLLLWLLRKLFGYRFIWWGIGFDPYRQVNPETLPTSGWSRFIVSCKDWLWRRSDANLVYSAAGKRYSLARGIPGERVFVLNNTLDVTKIRHEINTITQEELETTRETWGLAKTDFVFLFVGRFHPRKEVPFLVTAFSRVIQKLPQAQLILVGTGVHQETVKKRVESLHLTEKVILPGAVYDSRSLSRLFLISDLITLPGQVGLTVVHAFIHGKPVLTKKSRSFSPELDYLVDGVNGRLLPTETVEAYAEEMLRLAQERAQLAALSQRAWQTAAALTMENMAESFKKALLHAAGATR